MKFENEITITLTVEEQKLIWDIIGECAGSKNHDFFMNAYGICSKIEREQKNSNSKIAAVSNVKAESIEKSKALGDKND